MVNQRVRTPRKRKIWIEYDKQVIFTTGASPRITTLDADALSDLDISSFVGATHMRTIANWRITEGVNAASVYRGPVFFGIAWVRERISSQSGGNAGIPRPGEVGVREHTWLQCWNGYVYEPGSANPDAIAQPLYEHQTYGHLDFTQMRKGENDDRLCWVVHLPDDPLEGSTLKFRLTGSTLLALP